MLVHEFGAIIIEGSILGWAMCTQWKQGKALTEIKTRQDIPGHG